MHRPPPRYGVRTNQITGKSETYELPQPIDIEISRKELRDFLHGNTQWHDDPYAAPVPIVINEDDTDDQYADFLGHYNT